MRSSGMTKGVEEAEPIHKENKGWQNWIRERMQGLPMRYEEKRAGPDLAVGTRVLVIKGDALKDWGQMAIISRHMRTQVEITYRDATGELKTRRKQPASLIPMDDGIELVVDEKGWPRIRRVVEDSSEDEENEGIRSPVSDDE